MARVLPVPSVQRMESLWPVVIFSHVVVIPSTGGYFTLFLGSAISALCQMMVLPAESYTCSSGAVAGECSLYSGAAGHQGYLETVHISGLHS